MLTAVECFIVGRLTLPKIRFVTIATVIVAMLLLGVSFATSRDNRIVTGLGLGGDYFAFHVAGTILNQHGPSRLYDLDLQSDLYHRLLPGEPENVTLPYANGPFFAVLMRLLAAMPYAWSYAVWTCISLVLFISAFALAWRAAGLPKRYCAIGLLCALSFEPFLIECLHGGQISTFGLFWISLALFLFSSSRPFTAGVCLGVCAYKPTLLPLILGMLALSRQWRALAGFATGVMTLALISVLTVGPAACADYASLLAGYLAKTSPAGGAEVSASGLQTWKFIDLNSFLKLLGVPVGMGIAMLLAAAAGVAAFVLNLLRHAEPRTIERNLPLLLATAVTWTLAINVYVGVYDAVLLVPAALLTVAAAPRDGRELPARASLFLAVLWVLPWISGLIAKSFGFQPFTLAIIALGAWQLALLRRRCSLQRPSFDSPLLAAA
jgi:hypothetical protein